MCPAVAYAKDKEAGFTLIEFLVAVVILTVGLLALLETVNTAISYNLSNKMQSDAVVIADQVMGTQRTRAFADISSTKNKIQSKLGLGFVNYSVVKVVANVGDKSKRVQITVSWRHKKVKKDHSLTTIISNNL
jgi:type IV pilus assembly protein PilV